MNEYERRIAINNIQELLEILPYDTVGLFYLDDIYAELQFMEDTNDNA